MNFWKRYPADYQRKTARLTLAQHGAYTLLLDELYTTETGLPAELTELFRICRAMGKAEQDAVRSVVDRYFPIGDDGTRHNRRAVRELEEAAPAIKAARANGKKGGRPKNPARNPAGKPKDNPADSQNEPNSKAPHSSELREKSPPAARVPPWNPPAWMPLVQWEAFIAMRKAKGKRAPFTDDARTGIVAALDKLRAAGHDIATVLQESVNNGWSGVFAPKAPAGAFRTVKERDQANARDLVRKQTGGLLERAFPDDENTIDMEETHAPRLENH